MNILVTGGNGFIGGHLVRKLRTQGHNVVSLDSKIKAQFDIRTRTEEITYEVSRADALIHLAAVSRTPEAMSNPELAYRTNMLGTMNLLEAVRKVKPQCRFVHVSSNIVYGNSNHYRASKLMAEELVRTYTQAYSLASVILRYSNVYGPGMPWSDSICLASMRRSKWENGYITLSGDGTQTRDFTHVADIVAGTIKALTLPASGAQVPIDLCTGINTSMLRMAQYFDCPIQFGPERPGDTIDIFQNPQYATEKLDWEYTIPVASGIQDVLDDVPERYFPGKNPAEYSLATIDQERAQESGVAQ